jgi:integrase
MPRFRVVAFRGKFAAEWIDERTGKRRRRLLGTDDPAEVERRCLELGEEIAREARPATVTIEYAWKGKVASLGNRPGAKAMNWSWKAIGPFWGRLPADSVTEELCNEYVALRRAAGIKDGTTWLELSRLRAALRWAEKKNLISKAPFVWKPPTPRPRDLRLTREQAETFLAACTVPHLRLFVILALTTAARSEAILGLTWDRVNFDRRRIDLHDPGRPETSKGRAVVPMNETAFQALSDAREKAVTPYVIEWKGERLRNIKMGLRRAGRRCGMSWVSAHVFRHSAACWLAESGASMPEIAQYLGHRDSVITERVYARLSPTYLAKAASSLELVSKIQTT